MIQGQNEDDPEESGTDNAALFGPAAANSKGLRGSVVELHCPLHVRVEGFDHSQQFWWATNLRKSLGKAVSDDQIERLGEVYQSDVQGICCASPGVSEGEDHVYC